MKVVLDGSAGGAQPAGPATHFAALTRALLDTGDDLELVLRRVGVRAWRGARASAEALDGRLGVRAWPVPDSLVRRAQSVLGLPSERMLLGPFDVYHQLHADADPAVPDGRLVVTLHDLVARHWPAEEGAMAPVARSLLERCAAVITVSGFSRNEICAEFGLPAEKVHVIPNGVDTVRFNVTTAASALPSARDWLGFDAPYLLYVGGATPRKNVEGLFAAYRTVREELREDAPHLVLAGPVARREPEFRSALAGDTRGAGAVVDAVHFPGFVPARLLPGLYGGALALVSPSLYEGFGLPALEALACGRPVVAGRASALPEVVGGAAELVDPSDPDAIAAGILSCLRQGDTERRVRSWVGIARSRELSWEAAALSTVALYASVGRTCPPAGPG